MLFRAFIGTLYEQFLFRSFIGPVYGSMLFRGSIRTEHKIRLLLGAVQFVKTWKKWKKGRWVGRRPHTKRHSDVYAVTIQTRFYTYFPTIFGVLKRILLASQRFLMITHLLLYNTICTIAFCSRHNNLLFSRHCLFCFYCILCFFGEIFSASVRTEHYHILIKAFIGRVH